MVLSARNFPNNSVPEFLFPNRSADPVPAELSSSIAAFFPNLREDYVRLTTAKPALTHAMRWVAI
jgi:hypothetical protein